MSTENNHRDREQSSTLLQAVQWSEFANCKLISLTNEVTQCLYLMYTHKINYAFLAKTASQHK